MKIQLLSETYRVSNLEEKDISKVFQLCRGNPVYYRYCPPAVSEESIRTDMHALPEGTPPENKFYLGFWKGEELAAVMDLILEYPDEKTAWIGFFMLNADMQGRGTGSQIVEEACTYLKEKFLRIRLGYVKGNQQSEHFWIKNGFCPTGVTSQTNDYEIIVMQKVL